MNDYEKFKAIGDPIRIEIIKFLSNGAKSVGEIVDAFELSQPAISHHLNILKIHGLVTMKKHGRSIFYSINCGCIENTCCDLMEDCGIDYDEKEEDNDEESK